MKLPLVLAAVVLGSAVHSSRSSSSSSRSRAAAAVPSSPSSTRLLQQEQQHQDVCTNLKYRLYGRNKRLNWEDPCDCQRLPTNTTGTAGQEAYYQVQCRYDYCPACDPVTGLCAIRDETHFYSTYNRSSPSSSTGDDGQDDDDSNDLVYVHLNATFCREFVQVLADDDAVEEASSNTTTTTTATTRNTDLPPTFCVANVHHPTPSLIRNDYSCHIWIGNAANNTCQSCSPQVCSTTEQGSDRMRTSYDCTNLPQGGKVSYCGLDVTTGHDHLPLLDQYLALDIERASPFAAALYNYGACGRDTASVEIDVDDGMEGDENSNTTTDTPPTTTTDPPDTDIYSSTKTVIQSISLSGNGSMIGVGVWSQLVRQRDAKQDEIYIDTHVKVYQRQQQQPFGGNNNNSNATTMKWGLNGLPLHLDDHRRVYRNESSGVENDDVFLRLTSTGQIMVVGHTQQQDWDVHGRAYNGWPAMGNFAAPNFRYKVNQRLAIANHGRTVARVNHPLPGSFHTYATTPMVEVWDLEDGIAAGGGGQWKVRPTTEDDFSPTESVNMSDVSLSADGLIYAAGATGLPFVFVKEWLPGKSNSTLTSRNSGSGIWAQLGTSITADDRTNHLDDGFGFRVALASDGGRLAVGGYRFARFFYFDQAIGNWIQRGSDMDYPRGIKGELCVSSNGNVFAIGQANIGGANGTTGRLTTYQWDEAREDWSLRGSFVGKGTGDHFGRICSISGDGSVVAAAGSLESDSRIAGYVDVLSIDNELVIYHTENPRVEPTGRPTTEPSLVPTAAPSQSMAPSEALPTHGVDAVALSSDGSKVAVAEWTLRQRPTIISLLAVATINEKNAAGGSWNVISESDATGLYVDMYDKKKHGLDLDTTADASVVMFDNYFDLLVYDATDPEFAAIGEEVAWFSGFTRTAISDDGAAIASVNVRDDSRGSPSQVIVHDFTWNDELGVSEWVQRGEAENYWNTAVEKSGISLSSDGLTYAVGGNGFSFARVNRWDKDNSTWSQIGQDVSAADRENGASFGAEVFLSSDSTKLAVGAHTFARMYDLDGTNSWVQRGNDVNFAESVEGILCVSSDTDVFAIGQPLAGRDDSGRIMIHGWDGEDWAVVGVVDGIAPEDNFGSVCAVSADGTVVAAPGKVETTSRVRGYVEVIAVAEVSAATIDDETLLVTMMPSSTTQAPSDSSNATTSVSIEANQEDSPDKEPNTIREASSGGSLRDAGAFLITLLLSLRSCS